VTLRRNKEHFADTRLDTCVPDIASGYQFISLYRMVQSSWGSSVSIVSEYRLDDRVTEVRYAGQRQRIFLLAPLSGPALRPA
jgi:hypothetical protein